MEKKHLPDRFEDAGLPASITSDEEFAELVKRLDALDQFRKLTPQEDQLYDDIMLLILQYEAKRRPKRPWLL